MRYEYINQINSLKLKTVNFSKLVTSILDETITAVRDINLEIAEKVMKDDVNIDGIERDIENECMKIISLQRPFASDFRLMTGYIKLISNLGRIADHCADTCEIILTGKVSRDCPCKDQVVSTLRQVYGMFTSVLEACFTLDVNKAKEVYLSDDSIDISFADIITNVSSSISERLVSVYAGADLMFMAKYAERIGDRCVNISQWVIYMKEGMFPDEEYFM